MPRVPFPWTAIASQSADPMLGGLARVTCPQPHAEAELTVPRVCPRRCWLGAGIAAGTAPLSLRPLSRRWRGGSPAALHLGAGAGKRPASVAFCCSPPHSALGTGEVLCPLPSLSSSAPCARAAATWRLAHSDTHRGWTVPVHQLSWGHRGHWFPTLAWGDLANGVEWIGRRWP